MERNPSAERAILHANGNEVASAPEVTVRPVEAEEAHAQELSARSPLRSIRRIRSLTKRVESAAEGDLVEALHAEVLLLREENAQLRTKLERAPGLGDVVEQMRALTERDQT